MGQRHKHADVIIAWAEGRDVQVWCNGWSSWVDVKTPSPSFFETDKYRIKPPPAKKYRVALFRKYKDDELLVVACNSPVDAGNYESMSDFVRWLTGWIEYEE